VGWNVISVFLVGSTAMLNEMTQGQHGDGGDCDEENVSAASNALLGVILVMLGAFVQAMQFVFVSNLSRDMFKRDQPR
jgi:hypothetical protein